MANYPQCGELRVEAADTNEAKELTTFCRKFSVPLRQALRVEHTAPRRVAPAGNADVNRRHVCSRGWWVR